MLAIAAALFSSCNSIAASHPVSAKHVTQKNFAVGELKSVAVGETMISYKDYYEKSRQTVWSIGAPVTLRVGLGSMTLVPGDYAAIRHLQIGGAGYDAVEAKVHPFELIGLKPSSAVVPMTFLIDGSGRLARAGGGLGITTEVSGLDPADFRATRGEKSTVDATHSYTNFELLYSGLEGGAIRLTYREYAPGDSTHPSQFQDLSYNLSDMTVRLKQMLLEIESADNQAIRFRVKSVPQQWMSAGEP